MSLKEQAKEKKSKALEKMGDIYKEFLQSYLAWLYLQNTDSLNILSKTYEYISRYKDKTSIFTISMDIHPKRKGPYRNKEVVR